MNFVGVGLGLAAMVALTAVERPASIGQRWFNLRVWVFDIAIGILLIPPVFFVPHHSILSPASLPFWAALLVFVALFDLAEYATHRLLHAVPFLWRFHQVHHSDPDMNATTSVRHHWACAAFKAATISPIAWFIMPPTPALAFSFTAINIWGYVMHSSMRLDFGRWSWLLTSPEYHRRHHSSLPEHFNSNFSNLLPIWDILLGSYRLPEGHPPTGLEHQHSIFEAVAWPPRG